MLIAYFVLLVVALLSTILVWIAYFKPDLLELFLDWFRVEVKLDPVELAGNLNGPSFKRRHWPVGMVIMYAFMFFLSLFFLFYLKNLVASVIFLLLFGLYRYQNKNIASQVRQDSIDQQAEIALRLLATHYSTTKDLIKSLEGTAACIQPPLKQEFEYTIADFRSNGQKPLIALEGMADRLKSRDINVFVKSVILSEKMGTDTPQVINRVAQLIEKRIDLREELKNETKGQRVTVNIFLVAIPLALFCIVAFCPDARNTLQNNNLGRSILVLLIIAEYVGWYFTRGRKMVEL